jgi:hypothetical protein
MNRAKHSVFVALPSSAADGEIISEAPRQRPRGPCGDDQHQLVACPEGGPFLGPWTFMLLWGAGGSAPDAEKRPRGAHGVERAPGPEPAIIVRVAAARAHTCSHDRVKARAEEAQSPSRNNIITVVAFYGAAGLNIPRPVPVLAAMAKMYSGGDTTRIYNSVGRNE